MRSAALLLALLAGAASALHAEDLRGRVQLLAKGGQGPARGSDVRQAVVYFEPAGPRPARPPEAPFEMVTRRKEFEPRVLVIPRGSQVRFPNEDPILHNVFSVSSPNQFDLGLYQKGPGKEKRFDDAGLVRVYCNVHHDMVAYILVLDTPYSPRPGTQRRVRAHRAAPRARASSTVWHEQSDPWTSDVELPLKAPSAGRSGGRCGPLIPSHLNKQGQSYFRSRT